MKRATILIAEDNYAMRQKLVSLLEPRFEVLESVGDGQSLIDAALRHDADVLVVDIEMPVLGGIEAARRLQGYRGKIVFVTVFEDSDYVRECLAVGGVGFVVKSHLASDLLPAIDAALANKLFVSPSINWS